MAKTTAKRAAPLQQTVEKRARNTSKNGGVDIELPKFDLRRMKIKLVGDSSVICNNWSANNRRQMLEKQMKQPQEAKAAKNPEQEYQASLYKLPNGRHGFPTTGVKAAAVDACSHVNNITKVEARGAFHIDGDFVVLIGTPQMREDMVRLPRGGADIHYRGEFYPWSVDLTIRYNNSVLSAAQIVHLFKVAGFAIGIGDWRPQKDGSHGMFHVEPA
jgi:hypothetical protein